MTTIINGIEELKSKVGEHLGYSDWLEVTQDRVNLFADATGDHQWIHVDVERANAESPFGGPIAHGYLTLSLAPAMVPQVVQVHGFSMAVNYGAGKVRFPSPVPVGSNLRAGVELILPTDRESILVRTRLLLSTPALQARNWIARDATRDLIAGALARRAGLSGRGGRCGAKCPRRFASGPSASSA